MRSEKENGNVRASKCDTGWASIIVLSSFVIQLIIDGTISSFGVFYVAMPTDEAFRKANYTRTVLATPGSIQPGFFLGMCAFAGPLIQLMGFRLVGILGSLLVSIGLAMASYQANIHAFNLFYGVITGSGFGVLMVCAIVAVNYYFDRYRGLASGIAMSGAGIGYLMVPLLFSQLMHRLGWRTSLLVYSGAVLLVCLASVLTFRPFVLKDQAPADEAAAAEQTQEASLEFERLGKATSGQQIEADEATAGYSTQTSLAQHGRFTEDEYLQSSNQPAGFPALSYPRESVTDTNNMPFFASAPRLVGDGWSAWAKSAGIPVMASANQRSITPSGASQPDRDTTGQAVVDRLEVSRELEQQKHPDTVALPEVSRERSVGETKIVHHSLWPPSSGGPIVIKHEVEPRDIAEEVSCNELGSTVGSRLWKSTLSFRRENKKHIAVNYKLNGIPVDSGDIKAYRLRAPPSSSTRKRRVLNPLDQADIFFSGSLVGLTRRRTHLSHSQGLSGKQAIDSAQHNFRPCTTLPRHSQSVSLEADEPVEKLDYLQILDPKSLSVTARLRHQLVTLFDLTLFKSSSFLYLLAISVTNQLAYFIPFAYLVDFSTDKGLDSDSAVLLLVILGLLHTVGRIVSGVLANLPGVNVVLLSGFGSFASGLIHILLPIVFPPTILAYSFYAGIYGFVSALPIPMIPILLVQFLGLQRLTASYGNLSLFKSLASVVGPILAVNIVEYTGQKAQYFHVAGACMIISALFHLGLCQFTWFSIFRRSKGGKLLAADVASQDQQQCDASQ